MNIQYKTIRRITIIGSMSKEEDEEAREYILHNGYSLIRSGPMPIMKPRTYDTSRFRIVAEKRIR